MNKPWDIIKELESDNSRLFKESVVTREALADNAEFFQGVRLALDPMITFGVKQISESKSNGSGLTWAVFNNQVQKLINREATGHAAQHLIEGLIGLATIDQWNHWYRRILIKDLRCGVSEKTVNTSINRADKEEFQVPIFTCHLAHDSANHATKLAGSKIIEVKLDGVRVITVVYPNGLVTQFSRNGKELVNFEKIKAQISKCADKFVEPVVLDGEVMSASFQDLMTQVHRKSNVAADDAVLHLFDIITLREFTRGYSDHKQINRSFTLANWYSQFNQDLPNVRVVGQEQVDLDTLAGQVRFKAINKEAIDGGYEGIMIKDPLGVYVCKRSLNWLKMKPFIEVTLEVVDVEEGTGRNEGRLGALVCAGTDDGKAIRVNVGSGFSDGDRVGYWSARNDLVGQIVEVRADAITQNQDSTYSLRFPRFLRFRGFEIGEKL